MPARRFVLVIITIIATAGPALADLQVTSDFEGGSGVVESIDPQAGVIRLTPTPHENHGWVCWWYVKVTGITPGRDVTIDFGGGLGNWGMPAQAAFSTDHKTWRHTAPGKREGKRIRYTQKIDATTAWFAWGPPFTPSDAAALVERLAKESPYAQAFELCRTRAGRPVPAMVVQQPGASDDQRYGVWINARQHAWESGSSWVCRGLAEWLVGDEPEAEMLRKKAIVYIVPVMDIDNVAIGAGGKQQPPHDHNRDWSDDPHWYAVRAAIERITKLNAAGRFDLFIDLHNPGPGDGQPFYFVSPADMLRGPGKRNLDRFFALAKAHITGPLKLSDRLRESGPSYDKMWKTISKNWVVRNTADHVVAVTLETSWNTPNSTPEGYLTVGRQQGQAIAAYFREPVRAAVAE